MPAQTVTMSQLSSDAKAVHTGMIVTASALSQTLTLTASSVLLLSRVPNHATLLDFWMRIGSATPLPAQTLKIGTSASPSGIMQLTSLCFTISESAVVNLPTAYGVMNQGWIRCPGGTMGGSGNDFMPVRLSMTSTNVPESVWIQATIGGTISIDTFFTWCLFYTMDGMQGHTKLTVGT